ncbi:MAG: D-tyrosyl-tRNA(Tyr) deacylase [Acidobacteria bacterium]|nr:D-tyrosyl-tRNA(Tyr) deacylase [Acidobacteriota bacterium]
MRVVVQRVRRARIQIDGTEIASIGKGILALVGISRYDSRQDLEWMARKIVELRIFDDAEGKLNLSVRDVGGEVLLVSQFTLYGDCRKGRRPSYSEAAPPQEAGRLYEEFLGLVRELMPSAQSGRFQAMMDVELVNAGPVTLILDSSAGAG